ncbi:MAG: hypothetical protein WC444_06105 [Candidatus Paceibacterota bacterium]
MNYFAERHINGQLAGLGSDNGIFIRDLKTLKGAANRILKGLGFLPGTWKLYTYTRTFDESTYTIRATITKP